jgi:hypothetical protein
LPEAEEAGEMVDRLLPVALRFVQLAEPLVRAREDEIV